MNREEVKKILEKYNITMSEGMFNRLLYEPCNYQYLLDIIEKYAEGSMAETIAYEIYSKCIDKR